MTLLQALHGMSREESEMIVGSLAAAILSAAGDVAHARRLVESICAVAQEEGYGLRVEAVLAGVWVGVVSQEERAEEVTH